MEKDSISHMYVRMSIYSTGTGRLLVISIFDRIIRNHWKMDWRQRHSNFNLRLFAHTFVELETTVQWNNSMVWDTVPILRYYQIIIITFLWLSFLWLIQAPFIKFPLLKIICHRFHSKWYDDNHFPQSVMFKKNTFTSKKHFLSLL